MAVYVDTIETYPKSFIKKEARKYGQKWSHLYADTVEELHEIAGRIGLEKSWFQNRPNFAHYDVTPFMRAMAISAGAIDDSDHKVLKGWIKARLDKAKSEE